MCLSTVYERSGGEEKKLLDSVSLITNDNGHITLTDILGAQVKVRGSIVSLDLVSNKLVISPEL